MKVGIFFHRPTGERGVGKAIVALTWVYGLFYNWKALKYNYSHVEGVKPGEDGTYASGVCVSSTTRGDAEGVRFAPASKVIGKHPYRWQYIEADVDPERFEVGWQEAEKLIGAKYDFRGILGFTIPFAVQDSKKWYCSEMLSWLAYLWRVLPKRYKRISPRRLACVLANIMVIRKGKKVKKYGEPLQYKEGK